jgi:dihydrolipoamide dehydrogenase
MKYYDLLVVGSGAGSNIAASAYEQGMKVAIVDNGRFGGTCLNRGCIPTKILTYVADIIMDIEHSSRINLEAEVKGVDFKGLMERMRRETWHEAEEIAESISRVETYDFYNDTGEFIDDYTMKVAGEEIKGEYVILASGARPLIPPIDGLEDVEYLTNKSILELDEKPKSLIIVGGGYIAAEFGHFFSASGTEVTILGRNRYLVPEEDTDVSDLLKKHLEKRMTVYTSHEVRSVRQEGGQKIAIAKNTETGEETEFKAKHILVATGRRSNSDILKPEKTGVDTDDRGWIITDEHFRTSKDRIFAFGDALGKYMFRHVANEQSQIVYYNLMRTMDAEEKEEEPDLFKMTYHAIPRAVFSHPQIATVGMTLSEAKKTDRRLLVGKSEYTGIAKGAAMGNPDGFVRVICDGEERTILGASIIGPHAPILIQEITNLMNTSERTYIPMFDSIHIHPALPEVVQRAFGNLAPIDEGHSHHHHHK